MTFIALLTQWIASAGAKAQTVSTKNSLKIGCYIEIYYSYDYANPQDYNR